MKKQHQKALAVGISLIIVLVFLGKDVLQQMGINFPLSSFANFYQAESQSEVAQKAWQTFETYRQYAGEHNLTRLNSLSYKLSLPCSTALDTQEQAKIDECNGLMDSLSFFTQDFRQKDFTNVAYDDKQLVLSTEYISPANSEKVKTVIYFVRTGGEMKILALRFCFEGETDKKECVITDRSRRDQNHDGWWDDVEILLNR